eukprot:GHVH01005905.1.p1 GENE.GHVH01005905.1~~GHVH01005905.1.p1  ORF type:complete len:517 (+),score=56.38 GHVH01005905.1:634-2184(+)
MSLLPVKLKRISTNLLHKAPNLSTAQLRHHSSVISSRQQDGRTLGTFRHKIQHPVAYSSEFLKPLLKLSPYKFRGVDPIYHSSIRNDPNATFACAVSCKESPLVSVGVFVESGSGDEKHHGAAHFLEHINFRSFNKKSDVLKVSGDLNKEIEGRGAELNAFTSRDYTHYYMTCLAEDATWALNILRQLVFDAVITESDVQAEKYVILKEVEEVDVSVEEFLMDRMHEQVLSGPIGRPILGSGHSITNTTVAHLEDYREQFMQTKRISVLAVLGKGSLSPHQLASSVDGVFKMFHPGRVSYHSVAPPCTFRSIVKHYPCENSLGAEVAYPPSLLSARPIAIGEDANRKTCLSLISELISERISDLFEDGIYGHGFFYGYPAHSVGLLGMFLSAAPPMESLSPGVQSLSRDLNIGNNVLKVDEIKFAYEALKADLSVFIANLPEGKLLDLKVKLSTAIRGSIVMDATLSCGLDELGRVMMFREDCDAVVECLRQTTVADIRDVWREFSDDFSVLTIGQ